MKNTRKFINKKLMLTYNWLIKIIILRCTRLIKCEKWNIRIKVKIINNW